MSYDERGPGPIPDDAGPAGPDVDTQIVARVPDRAADPDNERDPFDELPPLPEETPLPVLLDRLLAGAVLRLVAFWRVLRSALRRAGRTAWSGLGKAWRAAPAGLAVVLPLAFVSGLLVGPAIAAPAAPPSDRASIESVATTNGAKADGAVKERHKKKAAQRTKQAADPSAPSAVDGSNDDIGVDGAVPAEEASATPHTTKTKTKKATSNSTFDPADSSLVYRYPTLTGQTVSPPARLTAKIAQTLPLPEKSGKGRRIVYSASEQHLWIVDASGAVVRDYPVTGRVDRPGPGAYSVYSKSEQSYNPIAKVSFTHMVRFAYGVTGASIGFHSIPKWENGKPLQTDASLGLALGRGGCIRQTMDNATFLYDWSKVGDKVVVTA